ncbi:phosphotransferase family protein [Sorangium sp. So ce388]|uniref:phosphotransferase family protein n=1 Tax=Sorangium sp. So ce388 TaxID=3133309 RepID=UPI003F5AE8A0
MGPREAGLGGRLRELRQGSNRPREQGGSWPLQRGLCCPRRAGARSRGPLWRLCGPSAGHGQRLADARKQAARRRSPRADRRPHERDPRAHLDGDRPHRAGHVVVRPYLDGLPLDLRAGRQPSVAPWEVIARVAATVHAIDVDDIPDLGGHATRRAHALSEISVLHGVSELREAEQWALAHLPEEEPSTLVPGDLLGQNILLHWEKPLAVIDWEYATRGDPAYDMAIVTRGARRPFQIDHGLTRLLDAYATQGRPRIEASAVRLYELCLAGRWYRNALEGKGGGEPPDQSLRYVERVLRRARAASGGREQG